MVYIRSMVSNGNYFVSMKKVFFNLEISIHNGDKIMIEGLYRQFLQILFITSKNH